MLDCLATSQNIAHQTFFLETSSKCFEVLESNAWQILLCDVAKRGLKPWPNDQTMLERHLRFAFKTKCLTVWPYQRTLLLKHFVVVSSKIESLKNVSVELAMFRDVAKRTNIACNANIKCLTNNVWSFGQDLSSVGKNTVICYWRCVILLRFLIQLVCV